MSWHTEEAIISCWTLNTLAYPTFPSSYPANGPIPFLCHFYNFETEGSMRLYIEKVLFRCSQQGWYAWRIVINMWAMSSIWIIGIIRYLLINDRKCWCIGYKLKKKCNKFFVVVCNEYVTIHFIFNNLYAISGESYFKGTISNLSQLDFDFGKKYNLKLKVQYWLAVSIRIHSSYESSKIKEKLYFEYLQKISNISCCLK